MAKIPLSAQASTRLPGVSSTTWTVERRTGFTCTGGVVIKDDDDDDGGSNRDGLILSLKPIHCVGQLDLFDQVDDCDDDSDTHSQLLKAALPLC